jgi:dienelactone hydrolase
MPYDPIARGPHPVGVRSDIVTDPARDGRSLAVELWYPADDRHADDPRDAYELFPGLEAVPQDAVRDAAARAGRHPLVLFSHGFGGHRRQSTFLCTHLASHGYVVAACDHTGNTVFDVMQQAMRVRSGGPTPDTIATLRDFVDARPADVRVMLDRILDGALQGGLDDVARHVDDQRIGVSGHSFGGWTTLAVTRADHRIKAALPLAPAGGPNPLPTNPLGDALDFEWGRHVPTLFIVADRDTLLPLDGMLALRARTPGAPRMVVLENTDHMHFLDRAEQMHELFRLMPPPGLFEGIAKKIPPIGQLAPPEHAYRAVRGLGLAHMDASLKANPDAARLLAGDLAAVLGAQGIQIRVH